MKAGINKKTKTKQKRSAENVTANKTLEHRATHDMGDSVSGEWV
jgi:hypothetical protein